MLDSIDGVCVGGGEPVDDRSQRARRMPATKLNAIPDIVSHVQSVVGTMLGTFVATSIVGRLGMISMLFSWGTSGATGEPGTFTFIFSFSLIPTFAPMGAKSATWDMEAT